jgi:hypothetical protein
MAQHLVLFVIKLYNLNFFFQCGNYPVLLGQQKGVGFRFEWLKKLPNIVQNGVPNKKDLMMSKRLN